MTDIGAAAAQPSGEGQGGAAEEGQNGSGLYDLSHIDPEIRPLVEGELKKFDGNVTKEFQKRAEAQKQWEPYEKLGLRDVPMEEMQELLEFRKLAQNPEQFKQWLSDVSEQVGVGGDLDFEKWSQMGQENGWYEDDGSIVEPEFNPQDLEKRIVESVQQQMAPLMEQFRKQETESRVNAQTQQIQSTLSELHEKHGEFDDEAVKRLALSFQDEPDAIQQGFDLYMKITGQSQSDLIEGKANGQPGQALNGGTPDTTPEKFTGFGDPRLKAAALARFKS